ncbi:MAG: glycosyltransferase family 2 protein [Prevotella sp.]|nr:glycosyltransferase family 2 protein [Prevotella sp.]
MTCHNRREKTLRCIKSLLVAMNENTPLPLTLHVYLTDDGCTDGTADAVTSLIGDLKSVKGDLKSVKGDLQSPSLNILHGDGNLYWAGGMRLAWQEAMKEGPWDYYLLLNDDTVLNSDAFVTLFAAEDYCREHFGREGIVSGMVCDPSDPTHITYGGEVFVNRFTSRRRKLVPCDKPQLCDWTHANTLLVPQQVVEEHGILYKGYRHGQADLDYGYRARRKGIPVVVTPSVCGTCPFDHPDIKGIEEQLCNMTLSKRREYLNHPLHSDADYLTMIRRCMPLKYPMTWVFRKMNLYAPHLYYWLNKKR